MLFSDHEWEYLCGRKDVAVVFPDSWMVDADTEKVFITDTDENREFLIDPTETDKIGNKVHYVWKPDKIESFWLDLQRAHKEMIESDS